MPTYDPTTAECLVFTYKEGLLSTVAHDLKLRLTDFQITWEDGRIEAEFNPRSIQVITAMRQGRENPGALSDRDKRQILDNIARDVLHPDRFPEIRFTADGVDPEAPQRRLRGELMLHGVRRLLPVQTTREEGRWVARARIRQPDFRIKPFTAMLGALKIKPEVDVEIRLPRPEAS